MNDNIEISGDAMDDYREFLAEEADSQLSDEQVQELLGGLWGDEEEFDDWLAREENRLENYRYSMGWEDDDFSGWYDDARM